LGLRSTVTPTSTGVVDAVAGGVVVVVVVAALDDSE
jgi:hypothetical protein